MNLLICSPAGTGRGFLRGLGAPREPGLVQIGGTSPLPRLSTQSERRSSYRSQGHALELPPSHSLLVQEAQGRLQEERGCCCPPLVPGAESGLHPCLVQAPQGLCSPTMPTLTPDIHSFCSWNLPAGAPAAASPVDLQRFRPHSHCRDGVRVEWGSGSSSPAEI